jgi:hypothetical protein
MTLIGLSKGWICSFTIDVSMLSHFVLVLKALMVNIFLD